ncbi:MAG: hypothetical protein QM589_16190 [Thermomicrobiales bacterium]
MPILPEAVLSSRHSRCLHPRFAGRQPAHGIILLLATLLALLPAVTAAQDPAATTGMPEGMTSAPIGAVTINVEGTGSFTADSFVATYGATIATASDQAASIFAVPSSQAFLITFKPTVDSETMNALRPVHGVAWADPAGHFAIVDQTAFQALTPAEATNVLRNLASRPAIQAAARGNLPPGLTDGIARYIEVPVLAEQARLGSLVQAAERNGALPEIPAIVTGTVPQGSALDAETMTASAYAFTAFVIGRSGVGGLRDLVRAFAKSGTTVETVLPAALAQPLPDVQKAWQAFLPRWFTSGWQSNAVAAFDLTPAQQLFDRGAYAAAADRARLSQQLYSDLGDETQLSRVETLLALCAVALQAETLMTDAQTALTNHDYPRAQALLAQADTQYALLPEEHRPTATLQQYHQIADDGAAATEQLANAHTETDSWLSLRSGRAEALEAGKTFARLGDDPRAADARALLASVDGRVRQLALILATLAVLLTTWFGLWMRSRAPQRFSWSR